MLKKFAQLFTKIPVQAIASSITKDLPIRDETLAVRDPVLYSLIQKEKYRQYANIELIASENFTSNSVFECLGGCLTNKYSEGYPHARYYGGNEWIDQIEELAMDRAREAFGLSSEEWGVNVQTLSGTPANFAVYTAICGPGGKFMGLALPHGGHLTHGYFTPKKKVSATSLYFDSIQYKGDEQTGLIDYEAALEQSKKEQPLLVVAGHSAYPRELDYVKFREIADAAGAYLMSDIAHIAGFVAAGVENSPFELCDIVTSTTHKSLRGPRAGIIFFNKSKHPDLEQRINEAVFPQMQGGPHNNAIAAMATQFLEVMTPEFKHYAAQVKKNAKVCAEHLLSQGFKLMTGGTDNHLMLWDLRPHKLTGSKMETICDEVNISLNKNSVMGDTSAITPGGCRLGLCAMTTRGCVEEDALQIAKFLVRACNLATELQLKTGKMLKDFKFGVKYSEERKALQQEVEAWSTQFPMPGFDASLLQMELTGDLLTIS